MDAARIEEVIGEFVTLKRSGANYIGLCPFHPDNHPSMSVSTTRQIFKCFSCGHSGNVVSFLMDHEHISYPEALKYLARKYGIEVTEKEETPEETAQRMRSDSLMIVTEAAQQFFQDVLWDEKQSSLIGLSYFRQRGFTDETIRRFGLGYAPEGYDKFTRYAQEHGYSEEYLVETGLCVKHDDGRLSDRFYGRVMFPIYSLSGRVIAFGGRIMSSEKKLAKYINSPESLIYSKSRSTLYGLFQAKNAIARQEKCIMVEGYADVISMHQRGIENVVASSGTALTEGHINLVKRFTNRITFIYDSDPAGIKASLRGIDMVLEAGMEVKVVQLPDGDDPDSFARKHTTQQLREYIDQHQTDFIEFKTELLLRGVTDPVKRAEAINSIVRSVSVIPDPVVRATYIRECVLRLGVDEQTLITQTNKYIAGDREEQRKSAEREARQPEQPDSAEPQQPSFGLHTALEQSTEVERLLIQSVIRHGDVVIFEDLEADDGTTVNLNVAQYIDYDLSQDDLHFSDPLYNRILQEAVEHSEDPDFRADSYFMQHPDPEVSQLAARLGIDSHQLSASFTRELSQGEMRQRVQHLILDFRMDIINQQMKSLQQQLRLMNSSTPPDQMHQLMQQYQQTQELRNALARRRGSDVLV